MRLFNWSTLRRHWEAHADSRDALQDWGSVVEHASWDSMSDIVRTAGFSPSPVDSERVVFDICGNRYRLICAVDFVRKSVFVKWFGTHAEYDDVDAATVRFRP